MNVIEDIDPNSQYGKFYLSCKDTTSINDSTVIEMFMNYEIESENEINKIIDVIQKFRPDIIKNIKIGI